ncbi:MAG: sigma 54-interacting transcriptional regulator [Micavibrio sp.]
MRQDDPENFGEFIGTAPVMQALYQQVEKIAASPAPAFITGETGSGKTLCAQALHKHSPRARGPFIALDCVALSQTALDTALGTENVTVLLDHIDALSPPVQATLLDLLPQSRARLICTATKSGLGPLRSDLFFRLRVLPLTMPPLRLRGDDIADIAQVFLLRFARTEKRRFKGLSDDAEKRLRLYEWPGNIHELKNTIRRAVVLHDGPALTAAMLMLPEGPAPLPAPAPPDPPVIPMHILERRALEQAIKFCNGDIPRAATLLEISPSTLYRKKALWEAETP